MKIISRFKAISLLSIALASMLLNPAFGQQQSGGHPDENIPFDYDKAIKDDFEFDYKAFIKELNESKKKCSSTTLEIKNLIELKTSALFYKPLDPAVKKGCSDKKEKAVSIDEKPFLKCLFNDKSSKDKLKKLLEHEYFNSYLGSVGITKDSERIEFKNFYLEYTK